VTAALRDNEPLLGPAQIVAASWRMLTRRERLHVGALAVVMAVNGALQSFSLAALLPVIGLMLDPAAALRHRYVAALSRVLGDPEPTRLLILCALGVLATIVLKNLVDLAYNYSLNRLVAGVEQRVAVGLLRDCMEAPYPWFLSKNSAVLVKQVMGDVVIWARSGLSSALSFISSAITLMAVLALLISINVLFGFGLAVAGALVSVGIIKILRPYVRRVGARKHEAAAEAVKIINHALTGAKDIKVHGTQQFFVDQFDRQYGAIGANSAKLGTVQPVPGQAIEIGIGLVIVLTAIYVALHSSMRAEVLAALAVYGVGVIRALPVFNQISTTFSSIQAAAPAIAGIQRLQSELAAAPRGRGAPDERPVPAAWEKIEVEHLSYAYPGSVGLALDDVSLTVERGARIGIVGASGSGKTTLVDVLTGLLSPSVGRVLVGGQLITPDTVAAWRQHIGYVSQHPFIADESLRFNVALGVEPARVDDARVLSTLEAASFGDVLRTELPAGLDAELGERGVRLSGGQRQRVAIARALYREASLLILDEATSALDSENERLVSLALARIPRQTTMLIVAHRLSTVKDCDRILVLDRGRVVGYDAHANLVRECPLYRRFVELGDLSLIEDDLEGQAAMEGRP
jgi:ATP-binding cassette, subfamily B, bacterial PglK